MTHIYEQDLGGFLLGIFVLIIFGAKVSGSHYNPAVTLAFIFRRDTGKFSRPLGIAYIIFQMAGGFLGGFIAYFFSSDASKFGSSSKIPSIVSEVIGSFFLAFLYLTQTENKTKMSNDPAITTLIIASSYMAAMLMVSGPDDYLTPLNPAVSFGTIMQQIFHNDSRAIGDFWVYLPFPLLGGLCAVFFHEFIYKKVQEQIQEDEGDHVIGGINDNEDILGQKTVL